MWQSNVCSSQLYGRYDDAAKNFISGLIRCTCLDQTDLNNNSRKTWVGNLLRTMCTHSTSMSICGVKTDTSQIDTYGGKCDMLRHI